MPAARLLDDVATGPMGPHNAARRSLTGRPPGRRRGAIMAKGFASKPSRFRQEVRLGPLPSLWPPSWPPGGSGAIYAADGFTPPHPTWHGGAGGVYEVPSTRALLLMRTMPTSRRAWPTTPSPS